MSEGILDLPIKLRRVNGKYHYALEINGRGYSGSTGVSNKSGGYWWTVTLYERLYETYIRRCEAEAAYKCSQCGAIVDWRRTQRRMPSTQKNIFCSDRCGLNFWADITRRIHRDVETCLCVLCKTKRRLDEMKWAELVWRLSGCRSKVDGWHYGQQHYRGLSDDELRGMLLRKKEQEMELLEAKSAFVCCKRTLKDVTQTIEPKKRRSLGVKRQTSKTATVQVRPGTAESVDSKKRNADR